MMKMIYKPLSADPENYYVNYEMRPNIRRVGEFSLDENCNFLNKQRTAARYLREIYGYTNFLQKPLSLKEGYFTWIPFKRGEQLPQIQRWIIETASKGQNLNEVTDAKIVTDRAILVNVAISPYFLDKDGLKIVCQKYNGVIFMKEFETYKKKRTESDIMKDAEKKVLVYGGNKFQQLISKPENEDTDNSEQVNGHVQFCAVFNADFEGIKVLYRAQINCLTPDGREYLEAKTQKCNIGGGPHFARKALKWWIQAYLTTAHKLVLGIRNESHSLCKTHFLDINRMLEFGSTWDVNVCFVFLRKFLRTVRDIMSHLMDNYVLIIECKPYNYEFTFEVLEEKNNRAKEYAFIEQDLKKHFQSY
ncbi:RAI1 like PD-(D/E)XK nuclease domain-containing protein [Ditylenchus destructor]|uniref:Decapping nuclease n=1 Tax=Ditylenchus destructor TaxID=166010 RepID=A0AAD4N4K8_9BILA|nr:RAI1 like PD-(D/E)XK nuclease domain-containing protein [Ditylenchus destructor]